MPEQGVIWAIALGVPIVVTAIVAVLIASKLKT